MFFPTLKFEFPPNIPSPCPQLLVALATIVTLGHSPPGTATPGCTSTWLQTNRTFHITFMHFSPMDFSQVMLSQIVELALLIGRFVTDDHNRIDLDRFSQIEAVSDVFYAILTACGDCLSLANMKLVWKAAATALATIESESGDGPILAITQVNHYGPLHSLTI